MRRGHRRSQSSLWIPCAALMLAALFVSLHQALFEPGSTLRWTLTASDDAVATACAAPPAAIR